MLGDVFVALGHQRCELLVQSLAIRHLLVELGRALLRFQRTQIVRQFVVGNAGEFLPARSDVADEVAITRDGLGCNPPALGVRSKTGRIAYKFAPRRWRLPLCSLPK